MTSQEKVLGLARSYIGKVKYVFGADDIEGGKGDCSSFTRYIYKMAGYDIPRTTGGVWVSELPEIAKTDLRVGDLVLFKNTYNSGYKDGVSHIGIYSGNGKFIHLSSTAGTVVESSLSANKDFYLGANRVITNASENIGTQLGSGSLGGGSSTGRGSGASLAPDIGLEWWGDIVKVVLVALLVIGGAIFSILAIKEVI